MFICNIFEIILIVTMLRILPYENRARRKSISKGFDAKLVILNDSYLNVPREKIRLNKQEVVIGSANDSDVPLKSGQIAARHAVITKESEAYYFVTFDHYFYQLRRNGKVIYEGCKKKKLYNGDIIILCGNQLQFELGGDLNL